jgi:hypothetical protein
MSQNQIPILKKTNIDFSNPIFINAEAEEKKISTTEDDWDVNLGFNSTYGECYDENSFIAGQRLTPEIVAKMKYMMTCAETLDPTKMGECVKFAKDNNLPVVEKRPENADSSKDESPENLVITKSSLLA